MDASLPTNSAVNCGEARPLIDLSLKPYPGTLEEVEYKDRALSKRPKKPNVIEIFISFKMCEVDSLDVLEVLRAVYLTLNTEVMKLNVRPREYRKWYPGPYGVNTRN